MNESPHRAGPGAIGAEGQFQQSQSNKSSAQPQPETTAAVGHRQTTDGAARRFLRLILPEEGPYIAHINRQDGRKYNEFASTISELWAIIKVADDAGHTVYHACANFREARHNSKGTPSAPRQYGRTKLNARSAQALWLDVDAGPKKPYRDADEAWTAVKQFCKVAGLPLPLEARSGAGLHLYWPLEDLLPRTEWERYAAGLKVLCIKHGLQADHSRTTDISSVLRPPGTHHRKGEAKEVLSGLIVGPFPINTFSILLEHSNFDGTPRTGNRSTPAHAALPDYLKSLPKRGLAALALHNLDRAWGPASGEIIAEQCAQLREFRDKQGRIPEPQWYYGLGVLVHCEEGDRLAHAWSCGDPRYTPAETRERLDRAREFGPTTCDKFNDVNPAPCKRCPHWQKIKSPIRLGRNAERSSGAAASERGEAESTGQGDKRSNKTNTEDQQKQRHTNGGATQNPFSLRWHGEPDANGRRKWLVKNTIPETGVGLLSGQWGTFKTFIAIDLAGAVMIGDSFAGRSIKRRGGVLFLPAEGAGEIPIRLCGLIEAKFPGHKGKLAFAWIEGCPTLTVKGAIEQLTQIAKEAADQMRSEFGVELVLVIIDTMSAAAGFADENSSSEGQLAMNVLTELSRRTGAFCMACDHFGKAVETGTRGTSAKEAAADVVIACLGEKTLAGRIANTRIAIRKLRGGATGAETAYKPRIVDMGVDEDKEQITTCAIEWSPVTVAFASEASKGKEWPKSATVFRSALLTAIQLHGRKITPAADHPQVRAVELDTVRDEFNKRYPLDDGDRKNQMTKRRQVFKRSRTEAVSRELIGCREIEGKFMVWIVSPEDQGAAGKSSL
jgi:hypothetical protein